MFGLSWSSWFLSLFVLYYSIQYTHNWKARLTGRLNNILYYLFYSRLSPNISTTKSLISWSIALPTISFRDHICRIQKSEVPRLSCLLYEYLWHQDDWKDAASEVTEYIYWKAHVCIAGHVPRGRDISNSCSALLWKKRKEKKPGAPCSPHKMQCNFPGFLSGVKPSQDALTVFIPANWDFLMYQMMWYTYR